MNAIIVFITTANRDDAMKIADLLIAGKLAACVQILPEIISVYRWRDEILQDRESLLLVKTVAESFDELEKTVRVNHSYEIPEIVAVAATQISATYSNWLQENTVR